MKILYWASCFLLLFSCRQKEETTTPVVQTITESVYASGKVKSKNQYEAFAPVSGIVREVHVTEGSVVKKGDPLLSIANETPQLNREAASLSAAYSSMEANADKLQEAAANIEMTKTKWQNDSLQWLRQQKLWNSGIGSRNELEQRELQLKNSATAYQTAQLRYRQLKQQLSLNDKQARKNLQISSVVAGDYVVRAKQNGKVYSFSKEPGEVVSPQAPVAIIGSASDFLLELQVDEYDIAKIKLGQTVLVGMDSYKGQAFEAVVSKIDPIMNERSRSITIEAQFTRAPPSLYPNLSVEANVLINKKENAITIPRSFLADDNYVVLGNGEKRKVTIGLKDYQKAEVLAGLRKDEVIKKPLP